MRAGFRCGDVAAANANATNVLLNQLGSTQGQQVSCWHLSASITAFVAVSMKVR
jgi:hypothetical protein